MPLHAAAAPPAPDSGPQLLLPPPPPPPSDATSAAPAPWYAQRATRVFATRLALRLVVLGAGVALLRVFSAQFSALGGAYASVLASLGPSGGAALFFALAALFCAVSPTGYAPAVLAGASFDAAPAVAVAYFSVVCGAALNLALVRGALRRVGWLRRRCGPGSRKGVLLAGLDAALARYPLRMTALVRLPFIANGALNYLLSLSPLPAAPLLAGSAIGLAPGAALFALAGGHARSVLAMIVAGEPPPPAAVAILVATSAALVFAIAAVVVVARRVARAEAQAAASAADARVARAAHGEARDAAAGSAPADAELPLSWQLLTTQEQQQQTEAMASPAT